MPFIEANWVWLLIALVIGVAILWWVWGRSTAPQDSAVEPPATEGPPPAAKIAAPPPTAAEAPRAPEPAPPVGFAGDVPPDIVEPAPKPVAKKAAAKPAPQAEAAPPPAPAKPTAAPKPFPAAPDKLIQLKGVGPKLVTLLNGLGVTRFAEIAAWTDADVERIDAQLGTFKGRIGRDQWIEQAGYLAAGDVASFEAKFGKLDG